MRDTNFSDSLLYSDEPANSLYLPPASNDAMIKTRYTVAAILKGVNRGKH